MYGIDRFIQDFVELGYNMEKVKATNGNPFGVIKNFEIPIGRFQGRVIDLGIEATKDFPRTVASAIHVKANPQLLDKKDNHPKVRNIIDSALGAEWRYWSHNFGWNGEKTVRRLMNQIRGIFANA